MRLVEVRGHDRVRAMLTRALERDRLPPALLFSGPEGVGKKTLALAVAQAALCEVGPSGAACGACSTCRRVEAGVRSLPDLRREADRRPDEDVWRNFRLHPDLVLVEGWRLTRGGRPRPEPEIRVDQVRNLIVEISGAPFEARRRVFVVDDAHGMNESAQNALLKSLEEPPPRSHVLLVTSAPLGLRQTIRSRCQVLRFGPLPRALVASYLREHRRLSAEEAHLRAGLGGGSLGAALAFESAAYRETREQVLILLERVAELGAVERMEESERLDRAEDPQLVLTTLRSLLRDVAVVRAGSPPDRLVNADVGDRLAVIAAGPLGERAERLAERVGEARAALRGFASRLLTFEVLLDALAGG